MLTVVLCAGCLAVWPAGMTVRELKTLADSLQFKARNEENINRAEVLYQEAISRDPDSLNDDERKALAAAYSNYSTIFIFERNNPIMAYPLLKKALALSDKYRDEGFSLVGAYTNMSHIFANFNDKERALDYLREGFERCISSREPLRAGAIYAQLVYMAWSFGLLDDIGDDIAIFKKTAVLKGSPSYAYNIEITKAAEAYVKGDYKRAQTILENAMQLTDTELDPEIYRSMTALMAAQSALKGGDAESCLTLINTAEKDMRGYVEFNANDFLNRMKGDYYSHIGREDLARECRYRSLALRDSLYGASNLGIIADMEQDIITTRYDSKLREAYREKEVLAEDNARKDTILIIVSIAATIIIFLLLMVIYKGRELRKYRRHLFRRNLDYIRDTAIPADSAAIQNAGETSDSHPASEVNAPEDPELLEVFSKVKEFFAGNREIYDTGFTIDHMSEMSGLSVRSISNAINRCAGKNFSSYLADVRISEACRILLSNEGRTRPTIEAVAEMVGYKSRVHFSRTFKSVTGLTPSEFMRQSSQA